MAGTEYNVTHSGGPNAQVFAMTREKYNGAAKKVSGGKGDALRGIQRRGRKPKRQTTGQRMLRP